MHVEGGCTVQEGHGRQHPHLFHHQPTLCMHTRSLTPIIIPTEAVMEAVVPGHLVGEDDSFLRTTKTTNYTTLLHHLPWPVHTEISP